jgi:hypothetical protein
MMRCISHGFSYSLQMTPTITGFIDVGRDRAILTLIFKIVNSGAPVSTDMEILLARNGSRNSNTPPLRPFYLLLFFAKILLSP